MTLEYSQHRCETCGKYFSVDTSDVAEHKMLYTRRVMNLAILAVVEDRLPYREASWRLWRDHRVFVAFATIQNWVEAGGKKVRADNDGDVSGLGHDGFSGYVAADELYDGPFCILSMVDNHSFKRLFQRVLDHDPSRADVQQFFSDFRDILNARSLTMLGFTTDGSDLYPAVINALFPGITHQNCQFHALANITEAVLNAVAKVRKKPGSSKPKLARGRPNKASRKLARKARRVQDKIANLFEYRFLFVRHHLTDSERRTLLHITRNPPNLRTLRSIMEQVYCLFDRRCRPFRARTSLPARSSIPASTPARMAGAARRQW